METILLADVSLPISVPHAFTYRVPSLLHETLQAGNRVLVPLGNRRVAGYVLEIYKGQDREGLKSIMEIMDECPLFPPSMIPFFKWVSDYYVYPLGLVIKTALPAGMDVKSTSVFVLSDTAPVQRDMLQTTEMEWSVLQALQKQEWFSPQTAFYGMGKTEFVRTLKSLEAKGYIRRQVHIKKQGLGPRHIKFVEALPLRNEQRLGLKPRQLEVLEYIEARTSVPLKDLTKALPGSDQVARRMEKRGFLKMVSHRVHRTPFGDEISLDSDPPKLTPDQERVFARITGAVDEQAFRPYVLHGVTGSGKTEIYMRAIDYALNRGLEALVLVPEINLSLSMEGLFRARFGENLALIHSGLSKGELYDQWIKIASGEVSLVLGARSAVFAPLKRPGVIIVDEEHDPSYKQDDRLRYNGRDLALMRGKMSNAVVILGSATPSFRTYKNVVAGKIGYLSLPKRIFDRPMPSVEVVDMGKEIRKGYFSGSLVKAMRQSLERREQVLLFLNRRGFAPIVLCPGCKNALGCQNCQISLTYHQKNDRLLCHYCGYHMPLPKKCPYCGGSVLIPMGLGTEKLEKEVQTLFPQARVARLDSDAAPHRKELFHLLKDLRQGHIDILLGTQMVTKGHDFPNVTLVGVLAADQSLHFPDFGASERTFQLLAQVSGRAGRGVKPGRVIIQTYNPGHYSIALARGHDFHSFYLEEILRRHQFHYPPFSRMMVFRISGKNPKETAHIARLSADAAASFLKRGTGWGRMLGPAPAPISRIKGKYRWQVLVMAQSSSMLNVLARSTLEELGGRPKRHGVAMAVDMDPISVL